MNEPAILHELDSVTHEVVMRYFDVNGDEIHEGDIVRINADDLPNSREIEVMKTVDGYLGEDATNPVWIQNGRAYPGDYGIYPFNIDDLRHIELIKKGGQ